MLNKRGKNKEKNLTSGNSNHSACVDRSHLPVASPRPLQADLPSYGEVYVSAGGFEPPTNGLKGHCSAVELRARERRFYHA